MRYANSPFCGETVSERTLRPDKKDYSPNPVELTHTLEQLRERSAAQWLQDANRWLPPAAAWLLVALIAWYGAGLLWALFPGQPRFDWSERAPATAAAMPAQAATTDFAAIAGAHLFGEADASPPPAAAESAPETRLNLKLRGTIAADDETIAHAIIADGSNNARVYFIEDPVPGGASLHEVQADKVILKRGGAFETLKLPKMSQSLGRNTGGSRPTAVSRPSGTRAPAGGLPADIANFTEIIRPQPFMPNGQMKGYRVYPGRDRRAFAALGLRPGDLVKNINGQPLDNIQTGMELFRTLGTASSLTVTVERNGADMVLDLELGQFNNASGAVR